MDRSGLSPTYWVLGKSRTIRPSPAFSRKSRTGVGLRQKLNFTTGIAVQTESRTLWKIAIQLGRPTFSVRLVRNKYISWLWLVANPQKHIQSRSDPAEKHGIVKHTHNAKASEVTEPPTANINPRSDEVKNSTVMKKEKNAMRQKQAIHNRKQFAPKIQCSTSTSSTVGRQSFSRKTECTKDNREIWDNVHMSVNSFRRYKVRLQSGAALAETISLPRRHSMSEQTRHNCVLQSVARCQTLSPSDCLADDSKSDNGLLLFRRGELDNFSRPRTPVEPPLTGSEGGSLFREFFGSACVASQLLLSEHTCTCATARDGTFKPSRRDENDDYLNSPRDDLFWGSCPGSSANSSLINVSEGPHRSNVVGAVLLAPEDHNSHLAYACVDGFTFTPPPQPPTQEHFLHYYSELTEAGGQTAAHREYNELPSLSVNAVFEIEEKRSDNLLFEALFAQINTRVRAQTE